MTTTLKAARQSANLTQRALAALAGVSERTIIRCEVANKWPRYHSQRRAICMALGLDWADLECER